MSLWLQVLPAVTGFVGVLAGSGISLIGQHWQRTYDRQQKKQSIAFAIAAEIEAYIDIIDHRGWVPIAEMLFTQAQNGHIPKVEGWLSEQDQAKDPFPIFAANMGNIGTLGPITGSLAKFYTRVIGIRSTIADMQIGSYDGLGAQGVANVIRGEIDLWLETAVLGRKIVRELRDL
ncbi:hypothetical protein [Agrobacterium tumefaciens]|uniref:hypothetical protein n=1 Tax=Agrobacterium tumefaciens TaxID=358 RepID=UPI002784A287|nr:hypothetical protein [Agrobacterium tumefaciens]MDP9854516.1 hypothetical protein [Agrobacterium tumefaciens]